MSHFFFFFTVEVWFHLSGCVNNQNSHIWSLTNLDQIKGTQRDDQKVCVSCAHFIKSDNRPHIHL
jgi:hypothetical protein